MHRYLPVDDLDALRDAIRSSLDPIASMTRVVEQAVLMVDEADGAAIEVVHAGRLAPICSVGRLKWRTGRRGSTRTGLTCCAIAMRETQRCDDTLSDSRVDRSQCVRLGIRSLLCVPLVHNREVIGALQVCSPRVQAFDDYDMLVLNQLADFMTSVVVSSEALATAADQLLSERGGRCAPASPLSQFVANVVAPDIVPGLEIRERIDHVVRDRSLAIALQPILDLTANTIIGYEALARFDGPPSQPPDRWFADAYSVGLGVELELAAAREALQLVDLLPAGTYLAINIGPQVLADDRLKELLARRLDRVVWEITEHLHIPDYRSVIRGVERLRAAGARLAVDDTGAGFASLSHILRLKPDIVKLDRELIVDIDSDPVRRALATSLVGFAATIGASIVAEGIENARQLQVVTDLGIRHGQGYHLGRPQPARSVLAPVLPSRRCERPSAVRELTGAPSVAAELAISRDAMM